MTRTRTSRITTCLALSAVAALATTRAVALDLSTTPLFLTNSVEPNVVFMIDDSGSMMFETLPEKTVSAVFKQDSDSGDEDVVSFVFPPADDLYGTAPYDRPVPGFGENDKWAAFYRSPENNLIYYDHTINYEPWVNGDGSSMTAYDPTSEEIPHHPVLDKGTWDITQTHTKKAKWLKSNAQPEGEGITNEGDREFFPPTYFKYIGDEDGDRRDPDNYKKVEIKDGEGPFPGGPNRTDCTDSSGDISFSVGGGLLGGGETVTISNTCTYEEEIQNFANWYTYHRSRTLAARNGIGRGFAERGEHIRVGYGTINGNVESGVRPFSGQDRKDFFTTLYEDDVRNAGTPLRSALKTAGEYYSSDDADGPWSTHLGDQDETKNEHYECRSSYTLLMTDGYYNKSVSGIGNEDGSDASDAITGPDGQSYTYSAADPFQDAYSGTLADVAMKYWKTDLRGDLDNRVATSERNPAFWQHMVTYGIGLGVQGNVYPDNPDQAFDAIESGEPVEQADGTEGWPNPTDAEDADKIDDLLHASVNSRGEFFSARDPNAFAERMSAILSSLVGRSSGSGASVAASSTRLSTESQVFQGRYDSTDWSGDVIAYNLDDDGNIEEDVEDWSAAEQLNDRDLSSEPRNIYTRNSATEDGVPFAWDRLSEDQKDDLRDGGGNDIGQKRLSYISGYQDDEIQNDGTFRNRTSILGDIINSTPVFTEDERYGYGGYTGKAKEYRSFIRDADRPPMIYVGGNDGMLHGFNADTGEEVFSYIPSTIFDKLADLTDPNYTHQYFVDGSVTVGDAYINGSWSRVLIGTTGNGGGSVFALDVTNPESFSGDDVLWEYTHDELGEGVSEARIVRTEEVITNDPNEYHYMVVFGNGYNSASEESQLFALDVETGTEVSGSPISTGAGDSSNPNGMATPFVVDENQDNNADYIYAGDLRGNVWKFFADSDGNWQLADTSGGGKDTGKDKDTDKTGTGLLFTAKDKDGNRQPITSKVDVGFNNDREKVVVFGTGKYMEVGDQETTDPQDLYGIVDSGVEVQRQDLLKQTLEAQLETGGSDFRVVSNNDFDPSQHKGWHVSLHPDDGEAKEGERAVVQPVVRGGVVIFTSLVPTDDPCEAGGDSWLTSVNINSGQRLAGGFFDVDNDGEITDSDVVDHPNNDGEVAPTSLKTDSGVVDTPTRLAGENSDLYVLSGNKDQETIKGRSDANKGPQSWRQVR